MATQNTIRTEAIVRADVQSTPRGDVTVRVEGHRPAADLLSAEQESIIIDALADALVAAVTVRTEDQAA